ncbi:AEC family transporter [Baaleninema simplex]|uniref:AEC family transporter n=1 Tax=Baaleninema simplex TaxID=2862350 RepID=UPI00034B5406|nr:AEC family transporter [Baaleninema simplex]
MSAILSAVLPVACIVAIGFFVEKTLHLDRASLSRLTLFVFSPALVADAIYRMPLTAENAAGLFLGFTVVYVLLCLLSWGLGRLLQFSPTVQKSIVATTSFPNTGNMGLSVTFFAFGETGLDRAVVVLIICSILVFSTGPAILKGGGFANAIRFTLKLPLIWAMLSGLLLRLLPFDLPFKLDEGLHVLAQGTIPMALLLLGMEVASAKVRVTLYEGAASLLRLLGGAIVASIVVTALGLTGLDRQVLILQSSMPAAVSSFLMVNEFGGDGVRTARVVMVSTLMAFVTLPLVLWAIS